MGWPSALERFWQKVNKDGPIPEHAPWLGQCWIWTAAITSAGYGSFHHEYSENKPRIVQSHVHSFELHHGRKPEGMLDHQCRVRSCVNPEHLKETTHMENLQNRGVRSDSKTGVRGVGFKEGKYRARIQVNNEPIFVGNFDTLEEASLAVVDARKKYMPNSVGDWGTR